MLHELETLSLRRFDAGYRGVVQPDVCYVGCVIKREIGVASETCSFTWARDTKLKVCLFTWAIKVLLDLRRIYTG